MKDLTKDDVLTGEEDFDFPRRVGRPEYIIEDLLPSSQVHLIGGPSGSGKTTLMFQMYQALATGADFLGRKTRPVKFAYISGDRPERSVKETQGRVGVDFPVYSLVDHDQIGGNLTEEIFPKLTKFYGYKPNFVYIDGFTALVPGNELNNYGVVAKWLGGLQRYSEKTGLTILGACHTTKTKEGANFLNPRQRIAGSVAWAGFSETVIIIEPPEDDEIGNKRRVMLLPRNYPGESMIMTFDDEGRLRLPLNIEKQEEIAAFVLGDLLPKAGLFTHGDLWDVAEKQGVPRRSFDRWLAGLVDDKLIKRKKKGTYEIWKAPTESDLGTADGKRNGSASSEKEDQKTPDAGIERGTTSEGPEETGESENET